MQEEGIGFGKVLHVQMKQQDVLNISKESVIAGQNNTNGNITHSKLHTKEKLGDQNTAVVPKVIAKRIKRSLFIHIKLGQGTEICYTISESK